MSRQGEPEGFGAAVNTSDARRFRAEALDLDSLPRSLRIVTALGIGVAILAVLLVLAAGAMPRITIANPAPQSPLLRDVATLRLPIPILIADVILLVLALTCWLAAAFRVARWLGALLLLVVMVMVWPLTTVALLFSPFALGGIFRGRGLPSANEVLAILAGLCPWVYLSLRLRARRPPRVAIELVAAGAVAAIITVADVSLLLAQRGDAEEVAGQVFFLMLFAATLAVPFYWVITGVDLAEVGAGLSAWATRRITAGNKLFPVVGASIAIAIATLAWEVRSGEASAVGVLAGLALISCLALLTGGLRRTRSEIGEPSFGLMLLLFFPTFVVHGSLYAIQAALGVSLLPPPEADPESVIGRGLTGLITLGLAGLMVASARLHKRPIGPTAVLLLVAGLWWTVALGNPALIGRLGPFAEPLRPLANWPDTRAAAAIGVLASAAGMLLMRRWNAELLRLAAATLVGLHLLSRFEQLLVIEVEVADLATMGQAGLAFGGFALGFLLLARRAAARRAQRLLSTFGLALVVIVGAALTVVAVVAGAHLAPREWALPANALLIMLVAVGMAWDALMSGRRFTNQDSPRFPRAARLLLYVGYALLFAAAFSLFKGSPDLGGYATYVVEDAVAGALGLKLLGMPVVLYLWLLAAARAWREPWSPWPQRAMADR